MIPAAEWEINPPYAHRQPSLRSDPKVRTYANITRAPVHPCTRAPVHPCTRAPVHPNYLTTSFPRAPAAMWPGNVQKYG